MNELYKELTKTLHNAQLASKVMEDELIALRADFEAEISPKKEAAKRLSAEADKAKKSLTEYAITANKAGLLDEDGPVKMKDMTVTEIDQDKAMEWAKTNMPVAIIVTLDEALLKPLAEKHPEWAKVSKVPKPFVASDLTKFVE